MPQRNLIHIIPGNRMGGIQVYASDICRHYRDQNIPVIAITRGARIIDSRLRKAGIEVRNAPLQGLADPWSIRELVKAIRRLPEGEMVIHTHRYRDAGMAVIARRLAKRPDVRIVTSRHTVRKGRDSVVFRTLYKYIDAHIFVSRLVFERFRRSWTNRAFPLPSDRIYILYNSLNLPDRYPVAEPERGAITALYHGPLAERKGLEHLIDALALLRDLRLRLMIAGNGHPDFLDRIRRRAATRGVTDRIDWSLGTLPDADLMGKCHFGVVPSVESEAFGLGNLRYMAYGRAQVATRSGAPTEFLDDGRTAILVAADSASSLADGIRRLAEDADLRRNIASEAFNKFSTYFDWNSFISSLELIYYPSSHNLITPYEAGSAPIPTAGNPS